MNALTGTERQLLAVEFCGLPLATPLVLLSGCVGFGEEYTRVAGFSNHDVGAVCLKGTTLEPRLGNPPHRVAETPAGMLNAIGLQNPGVAHVVEKTLPGLDFSETRFIANVSGSTVEEYAEVTRRFDESPIDAIEINISCPNVKEGGVAFGNDPDMSARVVEACRGVTRKPLITKLSPNQTDIAENARRCIEAGGTVTGEHGVGMEKIDSMCEQFSAAELEQFHALKRAFDPQGLLNPGKAVPTLHRCAELGAMHVHENRLPFPDLPRF